MLNCKCGFLVTRSMTFSIKQNNCPACGKVLMTKEFESEVQRISYDILSSNILDDSVSKESMTLLAIFIKNKYLTKSAKLESKENEEDIVFSEEKSEELIRDEIRSEFTSNEEDDPDSKIDRLRKVAKGNPFKKKTGPTVKRLS